MKEPLIKEFPPTSQTVSIQTIALNSAQIGQEIKCEQWETGSKLKLERWSLAWSAGNLLLTCEKIDVFWHFSGFEHAVALF